MKTRSTALLACLGLLVSFSGCASLNLSPEGIAKAMISDGDENDDGQLNQSEFATAFRDTQPCDESTCSEEFQVADANADDVATLDEITVFVANSF